MCPHRRLNRSGMLVYLKLKAGGCQNGSHSPSPWISPCPPRLSAPRSLRLSRSTPAFSASAAAAAPGEMWDMCPHRRLNRSGMLVYLKLKAGGCQNGSHSPSPWISACPPRLSAPPSPRKSARDEARSRAVSRTSPGGTPQHNVEAFECN
jgi:hypothetical protein